MCPPASLVNSFKHKHSPIQMHGYLSFANPVILLYTVSICGVHCDQMWLYTTCSKWLCLQSNLIKYINKFMFYRLVETH